MQPDLSGPQLVASIAGVTMGTVVPGNRVELLENGAFFDRVLERIAAAQSTIHVENYLWKKGELASRMLEALCRRRREGCAVRVIADAIGARGLDRASIRQLKDSGCQVSLFRQPRIGHLGKMNARDHRKLIVIDGCEAYVGGHCITDHWLGDAEDGKHYGDLSVAVHGPAVHPVQSVFVEDWIRATGEVLWGPAIFPVLEPQGNAAVHAAYSTPRDAPTAIRLLHQTAIRMARRRLWIQNPYFVPERELLDDFVDARRRGVDIRVLMPSASASDNPLVQHASHATFGPLLRAGIRIFEYPHTLLHQKAVTVDGAWSAVGSSNFDRRSFATNLELTLGILDADLAGRLDGVFEKYAVRSRELRLAHWRQRGVLHGLLDRSSHLVRRFL